MAPRMLVELAFSFPNTCMQREKLVSSLGEVLALFYPLVGRFATENGQPVLVCNDAGVPISFMSCASSHDLPDFKAPLSADFFDLVSDYLPPEVEGQVAEGP